MRDVEILSIARDLITGEVVQYVVTIGSLGHRSIVTFERDGETRTQIGDQRIVDYHAEELDWLFGRHQDFDQATG